MFEKKWFRSAVLFYLCTVPGNFLKYYLMFGVFGWSERAGVSACDCRPIGKIGSETFEKQPGLSIL